MSSFFSHSKMVMKGAVDSQSRTRIDTFSISVTPMNDLGDECDELRPPNARQGRNLKVLDSTRLGPIIDTLRVIKS
jgi:hypothetical protein